MKQFGIVATVSVVALVLLGVGIYVYTVGKKERELFDAVANSDYYEVKKWIRKGANVNAKDNQGNTPLHKSALADSRGYSAKGDTPLHKSVLVASLGYSDRDIEGILEEIGKSGASAPLDKVVFRSAVAVASLLIDEGADVNAKNNDGDTLIDLAARKNAFDVAIMLIAKGSSGNVNAKGKQGNTLLHVAARKNASDAAALLISNGADVNAKNVWGSTPLHYAALAGAVDVTNFLISKGADVNAQDAGGHTPLYWAIEGNKSEIAKVLINNGAHVNDDGDWLITGVANRLISIHNSVNHDDFMNYRSPETESMYLALAQASERKLARDRMWDDTIVALKRSVLRENPNRKRDESKFISQDSELNVLIAHNKHRSAQQVWALVNANRATERRSEESDFIRFIKRYDIFIFKIMLFGLIGFLGVRASTKRKR